MKNWTWKLRWLGFLHMCSKYYTTCPNMCTFFEKIVRFGYVVQNMLWILCANFEPFLTKIGLLRAIQILGSSHCPVRLMGQWLIPKTSNSSQQTSFHQKWLKIGIQYSKHILYNISESHNFFKKSAHVLHVPFEIQTKSNK